MGTFSLYLVLLSYSLLIQVHCQCERTQLVCTEIVSTSTDIWGVSGDGILLGSYTNEELQWIGCNNLGCAQGAFFCTQQATSMTFGSQDGYGMFALLGPGSIPSSFIDCCSPQIPRDICGSPAEPQSVNKLCQSLGYKSGTAVSSSAFCCPGTLWSGSTWTSDFIQGQLSCSKSITCIDPCTDSPTNNPTFIPTFHPTSDPTTEPTTHPTYYPTTNAPTTNYPTTDSPTTNIPTTSIPTDSPSTDSPTDLPTYSPTIAPSTPLSGENKVHTTEQQVTENINGLQSNGNGNNTNVITGSIIGVLSFVIIVLGIFVFKLMKSRNDKVKNELSRITSESAHTVVSSGSPVAAANNHFNADFGNHNMQKMMNMQNNNIHCGYNVEGNVNNQTEMVPNLQMNMPPVIPPVVMTPMEDNDNEYSEDESQVDVVMKTTKGGFIDHDNAVIDQIDSHYQTAGKMPPPPSRVKKNMTEGNEIVQ